MVRMAYLGVIASHTVNGVAAIHSQIIRDELFRDFAELWPEKFTNVTNGVTQRRWLAFCNEPLRRLITTRLGSDAWIKCAAPVATQCRNIRTVHPDLPCGRACSARARVQGPAAASEAARERGRRGLPAGVGRREAGGQSEGGRVHRATDRRQSQP